MGIAYSLANIGNVYFALEQYQNALNYNLRALDIKYDLGDPKQIAYSLRTTGLVYQSLKQFDEAKEMFKKALGLYQETGALYGESNMYYHLGNVTFEQFADKSKALIYYEKALEIYNRLQNYYGTAISKYEKAKAYMEMGQYEMARLLFGETLDDARKIPGRKLIMEIYREYAELYKKQGDYLNALVYFEKFAVLRDSLFTENTDRNIAEMQTKYNMTEKEAQIQLLTKEKKLNTANHLFYILLIFFASTFGFFTYFRYRDKKKTNKQLEGEIQFRKQFEKQLKESEAQLTEANATKDKFFSIISHDLKSPFGAMMGLSELLDTEYDLYTDNEKKEIIKEIRKATESTYSLLQDLLAWSQSQRGIIEFNPVSLCLYDLCRENLALIQSAANKKRLTLECNIDNSLHVFADYNMVTTIIRNLMSNAIKFSHSGSSIQITGKGLNKAVADLDSKQMVDLNITDQGVGINEENMQKLFKIDEKINSRGTAKEIGTGLGLIICKEFIERNGGTIQVKSKVGAGTTFTVSLPAAASPQ
nr:tetratricopeptide repeat protein [Bacteroidota bacterium]